MNLIQADLVFLKGNILVVEEVEREEAIHLIDGRRHDDGKFLPFLVQKALEWNDTVSLPEIAFDAIEFAPKIANDFPLAFQDDFLVGLQEEVGEEVVFPRVPDHQAFLLKYLNALVSGLAEATELLESELALKVKLVHAFEELLVFHLLLYLQFLENEIEENGDALALVGDPHIVDFEKLLGNILMSQGHRDFELFLHQVPEEEWKDGRNDEEFLFVDFNSAPGLDQEEKLVVVEVVVVGGLVDEAAQNGVVDEGLVVVLVDLLPVD